MMLFFVYIVFMLIQPPGCQIQKKYNKCVCVCYVPR